MQFQDREAVPGTNAPVIYIGHRFHRDKSGLLKVSRKWHAEYSYKGAKHHEPLRTTNKVAAIKAAHAIVQRLERGVMPSAQRRVEWQEMFDGYVAILRAKGRAQKTVEKYRFVLGQFMKFARERNRIRPDAIAAADFWAFNELMMKSRMNSSKKNSSIVGLHGKTRADRLTIVKQWFKWAFERSKPPMLTNNPIAGEEIEAAESDIQPCFTPDQVAQLLAKADANHQGPIFAVMAYLGLRFGEVRDLMWSDFNVSQGQHGWVTIQRGGSNNRTKGKCMRRIPLNQELRSVLDQLPHRADGYVFGQRPSKKFPSGGRLNDRRLLMSLKRLCRRCGFENPTQYKLHTFRHAFASMLARNNVAYKQALAWLGHKDSAILDLYIKLFDPDAERAMQSVRYACVEAPSVA
jgi:site-specific recombinase XerD